MKTVLTWDENKRKSNLVKHGLDFAHVVDFDTESAVVIEDRRGDTDPKFRYAEPRFIAIGLMRGKLVVLVYSKVRGGRRIISLRSATNKEGEIWLKK